jgi:hypothetical protein
VPRSLRTTETNASVLVAISQPTSLTAQLRLNKLTPYPIHRATQTPLRLALPSQEEASGLAACPHAQPNTPTTSCREQLHLLARVGCATGWGGLLLRAMHDRSRSGRQHERRTGATPHERPAACPSALTAGQRYPVRPLTPP